MYKLENMSSPSPNVLSEIYINIVKLLKINGLFENGDDDERAFIRFFIASIHNDPSMEGKYNAINAGILYVFDKKKGQSPLKPVSGLKLYHEIMGSPVVQQTKGGKRTGRRTQKRPTARLRLRRGSSKARKARTTRRK